jgi:hypothetical protein
MYENTVLSEFVGHPFHGRTGCPPKEAIHTSPADKNRTTNETSDGMERMLKQSAKRIKCLVVPKPMEDIEISAKSSLEK